MDCDKLKPARLGCSIVPQVGDKMYKLKIKLRHVVTTYKDQEGLALDIWHCDQRNSPKLNKRMRKRGVFAGNINWNGEACDDTNAFNLTVGANKKDIKQKSLRASRLLRNAESAVVQIRTYISDHTAYL